MRWPEQGACVVGTVRFLLVGDRCHVEHTPRKGALGYTLHTTHPLLRAPRKPRDFFGLKVRAALAVL